MAEPLPMPAQQGRTAARPLDPTEVIPGPQPLATTEGEQARVISGEVVNGRHRPRLGRGPAARSAVGTAVITATGAVVGLGLLLANESSDAIAARGQEPAKSAPDEAADQTIDPELAAAAAAVPAEQTKTAESAEPAAKGTIGTASTVISTAASSKNSPDTASGSGRHARPSGNWDSADWQEALGRAAAAQRSAVQGSNGGRHRAGGGFPEGGSAPDQAQGGVYGQDFGR